MFVKNTKKLTLKAARLMGDKALEKCEEIGKSFVFTVVDAGGNVLYTQRMEDAFFTSVGIATDKAFTAAAVKKGTHVLTNIVKPENDLFGLNLTNNGRIITFGGGLPVIIDGEVIGGVGVSGGSVEEDMAVAQAALDVLPK
ncbi:GlcG/HbpS family heme-binding protein [Ilyobacter polytropus]|uniref:ATP:cob(I)alamin adenosyltransferase n=1 Tax=Ilyobacter polytropus (strain ATCC 51220 / DSM 2926 / LMG 16218 / CuHBu1) TaxID=572544 RepID=E3HC66_ILYPC|nr:heme-binding protein [Ilyobacter polytropus]ADO83909.1 ATP:cob(I)alamin adenosyltransferase [Ilyobacter polytropus DSM 2926]